MWPWPALTLEPHGLGHPHRHRAFLRVAERQVAVRGEERDVEVHHPFLGAARVVNAQRPLVGANHRAVRRHPFVPRLDHARVLARLHFQELLVHRLAEGLLLRPEIVSVDRAMSKPQRAVMLMVVLLARRVLHRPIARHRRVAGADERVTVRPGHILEDSIP